MKLIGKTKRIALIAHDAMKDEMIEWARKNKENLMKHKLCGTGTTSTLLESRVGLEMEKMKSGPYGGDLQIGAKIAEGEIDMIIFFHDPLTAQPHDPDIKALLRVATLYDLPIALNRSTAEFLMSSKYLNEEFERNYIDMKELAKKRSEEFKDIK